MVVSASFAPATSARLQVRSKIAMFCHVEPKHVLSVHDCSSIYRVPLLLESQGVFQICKDVIGMTSIDTTPFDHESDVPTELGKWRDLADRYENLNRSVKIVLVGKYTALSDAYASVIKALRHSCLKANHKLDLLYVEAQDLEEECKRENPTKYHEAWGRLCTGQGILVPGGFGTRGIEGKIAAINWARTKKIPFFGICLGFQLAVVEFSRNILGWTDANSTEVNPDTAHPVIVDMPEVSTTELGGTMRLGKRRTKFVKPDCLAKKLYVPVALAQHGLGPCRAWEFHPGPLYPAHGHTSSAPPLRAGLVRRIPGIHFLFFLVRFGARRSPPLPAHDRASSSVCAATTTSRRSRSGTGTGTR